MKTFKTTAFFLFIGLLGTLLVSCNKQRIIDTPKPKSEKVHQLIAFIDNGDGKWRRVAQESTDLKALNKTTSSATIIGLGSYFHNQFCELGVILPPGSRKTIKSVTFTYESGLYSPSVLPQSKLEYDNRTIPENPNGYDVNFRFYVIGDVYMYITLSDAPIGVDIDVDPKDNTGGDSSGVDVGLDS